MATNNTLNIKDNDIKRVSVSFLATDQIVEDNIISPIEKEMKPGEMVYWGEHNDYPNYIENLYLNVATFKAIVDGATDYICGDEITFNIPNMINKKGQTLKDIITYIAKDLIRYGGFALNVIRNKFGTVAEIYYIDFKKIRSNKDNTVFYYTENWGKSYGRLKCSQSPNFFNGKNSSSIFYYKNDVNYTYPIAPISAAVRSCETAKMISQFHYNDLQNGFAASYIVNFNSGKPTDEQKAEIENNFYNKFCGPMNSSRPMLSFNNTKEHETTVAKIDSSDFDKKYESLINYVNQDIFTAFRCSPILFGVDQEKTGFNANEYMETFKIFNKTMIEPRQKIISETFDKIFEVENCIQIKPFAINFEKNLDE